jgi:hypothetical protein
MTCYATLRYTTLSSDLYITWRAFDKTNGILSNSAMCAIAIVLYTLVRSTNMVIYQAFPSSFATIVPIAIVAITAACIAVVLFDRHLLPRGNASRHTFIVGWALAGGCYY